jgi:hypothetical protein
VNVTVMRQARSTGAGLEVSVSTSAIGKSWARR